MLESTCQRHFKQGWNKEAQRKLLETPAAGALVVGKGIEDRIFRPGVDAHDMNNIMRHPSVPIGKQTRSIYQTSHEEETQMRYLRHQENKKKMSKDQVKRRWNRCLLQMWNRTDDTVSEVGSNFSVMPAGVQSKKGEQKDKAKKKDEDGNDIKTLTSNCETKFNEPSAWAVDRDKEPKESRYLSQCRRDFVKHAADVIAGLAGRIEGSQRSSQAMHDSLTWEGKPPSSAGQDSTYQSAFGKPKTKRRRKKKAAVFDDI